MEIEKREQHILTIKTDNPACDIALAGDVRFMVGDRELGQVMECNIDSIEPNSIVTATIKVAVRLGG